MVDNIFETIRKFAKPLLATQKPDEAIARAWFAASAEDRITFVRNAGTEAVWAAMAAAVD